MESTQRVAWPWVVDATFRRANLKRARLSLDRERIPAERPRRENEAESMTRPLGELHCRQLAIAAGHQQARPWKGQRGSDQRLEVVIDGRRGIAYFLPKTSPSPAYEHNRLGAVFTPVDMQANDLIGHVADGSPAYEAGIRPGDVIQEINRQRIRDAQSAVDLTKKLKTGRVLLRVWSKGGSRYLVVEPSEKK